MCVCVFGVCVWGGVKKKRTHLVDAFAATLAEETADGVGQALRGFLGGLGPSVRNGGAATAGAAGACEKKEEEDGEREAGRTAAHFDVKSARGGFSLWPPFFTVSLLGGGARLYTVLVLSVYYVPGETRFRAFRKLACTHFVVLSPARPRTLENSAQVEAAVCPCHFSVLRRGGARVLQRVGATAPGRPGWGSELPPNPRPCYILLQCTVVLGLV